ncbi:hypothetical protein MY8738_010214 [Beauveria namnaoensis]
MAEAARNLAGTGHDSGRPDLIQKPAQRLALHSVAMAHATFLLCRTTAGPAA